MTANRIKILKRYNDLTVPSDNTRVVSPYRIMEREGSRSNITQVDRAEQLRRIREAGRKQKEEEDARIFAE
jgi:hypothetical protein